VGEVLAAFLVAEAVLAGAAAAARGNATFGRSIASHRQNHPVMKHIVLSLSVLVSVAALAQDEDFHLDKEYAISATGTIDLSSSDADVIIIGSTRSATAHVKIDRIVVIKGWYKSSGTFKVDVETENGNLRINEKQSNVNVGVVGYYDEKYKIQIEAPQGASLVIRGDDGDYFIKNINGSISMNFDDGDAQLVNCNGSDFRFRLDDGDLKMDKASGKLDVVADDADIEILNATFTDINARFDDGDFIVHTSLTDGGDYSIDSQDGLVVFNVLGGGGQFSIRHDDSSIDADGEFYTLEDSETFTKLSLGKGSAKVNVRADDASVKLVAK
jgi:hypothetical protein